MTNPWNERLQQAAECMIASPLQKKTPAAVLKQRCPKVYRQIISDKQHPNLLALWGQSLNVDEHAGEQIVHPTILQAIGETAGIPMRHPVVHAGLQHTYGYLFSLIDTPYGLKRERWIETGLERGLGISDSLLGPCPKQGTLLGNATYLLGRVAFRGKRYEVSILRRHRHAIAPHLTEYPYRKLRTCRILERIRVPNKSEKKRWVTLQTDLVTLPRRTHATSSAKTLLVYSTVDELQTSSQLITAFTIEEAFAHQLIHQPMGSRVEIRTRFNAYVPGSQQKIFSGRRSIDGNRCL